MTPIGHLSISYLSARATRCSMPGVLLGGLWPDADFLLLPLDSFSELPQRAGSSVRRPIAGWSTDLQTKRTRIDEDATQEVPSRGRTPRPAARRSVPVA